MEVVKRQDMPPEGGYKPISFKRVPAKTFFGGWTMIGGYVGITAAAAYIYYLNCKVIHEEDVEKRSANFALYPLLLAERDREYLKQLRRNNEEEAELMKNVEGWKVGTWYGEPIYKTTDQFVKPRIQDFYVHSDYNDYAKRANLSLLS